MTGLRAPVVIAHRGCPRHAPENSLAGIRAAGRLGADAVELDVRLTRDGVPVLLHDPLLLRTTGRPWPVRAVTAATLRTLLLKGSDGERVPTLDEALRTLPGGLQAALDVKVPSAGAAVLDVVDRLGDRGLVRFWSQHPSVVRTLAAAVSGVEVALLRDTSTLAATIRLLDEAVALGATAVSVHAAVVSTQVVDACRSRGLRIYSWAQQPDELDAMVASDIDGIVTDWVEAAVAAVAATGRA